MICPFCSKENTKVLESRLSNEKTSIRRRRECESCSKRFTTYERVETTPLLVVKKSKNKEPFSKEKLIKSIEIACAKTKINSCSVEKIVKSLDLEIALTGKKEVSSAFIAEIVLNHLKNSNESAYIRYLSVYKNFNSIEQFQEYITSFSKALI